MFSLLKYAKNYRKELILGPLFKLFEAIFELLLPICMARLIDQGINQQHRPAILFYGGLMLLMSVIGLGCVLICQYYASVASQGFGTELRKEMMHKINQFSHKELDEVGTSTLVTRMTNDINQLQLALAMLIRLVIRAPFLSIGSIIMAFYIDPQSAVIFLIVLPLFSLLLYIIIKRTVPLYKNVQQTIDHLNEDVAENLSGVRVIRSFAKTHDRETQFIAISNNLANAYIRVANWSANLNPLTTFMMNSAVIALLYFGGLSVNSGRLQQGDVLALINYMTQMLLALIVVSNLVVIFTRAAASNQRVMAILAIEPVIQTDNHSNDTSWQADSAIKFTNISFRYTEKSGAALQNISFSVKKGQTLGITGPTGSGKSTLVDLIPKFYTATSGTITINNHPIDDYTTGELRQHIAVVPQVSQLFSGTIRSNLLLGNPKATDADCLKALTIAQCDDFVLNLANGLDEPVQARGKNFSGGQRQRLTIARALVAQPDILILDDSLSALDYKTDLALRQALKTQLSKLTLIIVSQRMSSIEHANSILVLDDGREVGLGTHHELLENSIVYQKLVQSQQQTTTKGGE
ncbi:ATP-binding protein [Vagococcus penaei]|uniref:ATP-binding protein n=1 Tax=Vagococcus penaei TaxID=633807 RepID=A0A1Q2D570_9ENTE|nr:ABC transporter ATP-binding protein [Vagococcus penaei]AQP53533.1 ATP-binding protein [Vagococcus penaei]RSU07476.1 ATP-binding protein [Vagococcus penaei]